MKCYRIPHFSLFGKDNSFMGNEYFVSGLRVFLSVFAFFVCIHPSNYILQNNEKIRVKSIPVSGFEVGDRPVDWPGNQE